jgi:hypothetical protein
MPVAIRISCDGRKTGCLPAEDQELRRPLPDLARRSRALRLRRAVRGLAMLCLVVASAGCVLTQDIPDPALDVPRTYKHAGAIDPYTLPAIDW